ncbi:hypothetical protein [uncultured Eudoraea sp.]|jgi:hypothetical protein|uniref:hypothetical protein n=1 Tax=uncultured Eudoraea sp. TaxID=1035614 RepID=UPI002622960B|nr:hypothetical protein [uncultured Eudoraea sp.]
MAKEKLVVIKEADITNNCPECFNQDMKITFYQKHLFGRLYHKITSKVSHQIKCNTCESIIYPVNWTEDIERIFEYYQKMVNPEKATTKFTAMFYLIILLPIVIAAVLFYLYKTGIISF